MTGFQLPKKNAPAIFGLGHSIDLVFYPSNKPIETKNQVLHLTLEPVLYSTLEPVLYPTLELVLYLTLELVL